MTELTTTATKIVEVFRYFRIRAANTLFFRLFLTRKHLWQDLEEEEVHDALNELIQRGFIMKMEDLSGWILLEPVDQYLNSLKK